jgi:small conductance mechanosensitive channel
MLLLQQLGDLTAVPSAPDSIPSVQEELSMLQSLPLDDLIDKLVSGTITFAINLAVAIFVFYIGKFVISRIFHVLTKVFIKRSVDRSLSTFVLSLIRMVLYFILIVTVISIMGIETSSFIAIFASAGVAVGMALSGTLQNFAGGVLILLLKPYKVGDYIEAQGYSGTVREIQIFHTIICTVDNKSIIIPNGGLSTGSINNWSKEDYRRVDWLIGISYGDDVDVARKAILKIIDSDNRIVKKFIEDDRESRSLGQLVETDNDNDSAPVEEKPQRSMISRMFHHHHAKVKDKFENWQNSETKELKMMLPKVDRSPAVVVSELADSAVVLKVSAWTQSVNYWGVFFDVNELIYKELPKSGVNFPFPQMDVHISQNN